MNRSLLAAIPMAAGFGLGVGAAGPASAQQADMRYYFFASGDSVFTFQTDSEAGGLDQTRTFHRDRCLQTNHRCGAGDIQTEVSVGPGRVRARTKASTGFEARPRPRGPRRPRFLLGCLPLGLGIASPPLTALGPG